MVKRKTAQPEPTVTKTAEPPIPPGMSDEEYFKSGRVVDDLKTWAAAHGPRPCATCGAQVNGGEACPTDGQVN